MASVARPPVITSSSASRGRAPRSASEASTQASESTSSSQRFAVMLTGPKSHCAAASTAIPSATAAIIVAIAELRRRRAA